MEGQEGADPAGQEQPSNGPAEHAGKMRYNFRTKANSVGNMPAKCSSGTKWHFACGARMTLISLIVHAVELELGAVCHAGPLACLDNSHHGELRFRLLQQTPTDLLCIVSSLQCWPYRLCTSKPMSSWRQTSQMLWDATRCGTKMSSRPASGQVLSALCWLLTMTLLMPSAQSEYQVQ